MWQTSLTDIGAAISHMGPSSIVPERMQRMRIVDFCYGIRSENTFCKNIPWNLAYRRLCCLDLEDAVPDRLSLPSASAQQWNTKQRICALNASYPSSRCATDV